MIPLVITCVPVAFLLFYSQSTLCADRRLCVQTGLYVQSQRLFESDHPNTAKVLGNYSHLLRKIKRDEEAAALEARVIAVLKS